MTDAKPAPEKTDYFKNGVIVMLTLVSVFAALVTFLQNYASLRSSDLAQQSSFKAVNATGLFFHASLDSAHGTDVLQRYEDDVQRAVRADTKARALRMGGKTDLAAEYDLDADRWLKSAQQVAGADPLLAQYNQDQALYRETLSREAYVEEEREHTLLDQARVWSAKANGYVAVLSTLSVALFLSGLSLTLGSRLRYLLAAAGALLTLACGLWVVVVLLTRVPRIPEDAIQHFADGRIEYTLATDRGEDATGAIAEFNEAIDAAPDYGRAYFYRSLANTDSSLTNRHLDTQQAIDDGLRAIALGNDSSPVFGNLGWLYYLNGQYNSALENTQRALAMSPNDCYLPFNNGLTFMALGREPEAQAAYSVAIDCAQRQGSDTQFNYFMDIGVVDLTELSRARPDLVGGLEPAIVRLKESQASLRMYGDTESNQVDAQFEPPVFGDSVDSNNIVQGVAEEFPQTATILYAQLKYDHMNAQSRWMTRWLLDGREYLTTVYDTWDYEQQGTAWVNVYNNGGLNSGTYELDVFVDGRLVTRGQVVVLPGKLPSMDYYSSNGVGVTVSYPQQWKVTDLADNEVSVVAARDTDEEAFFGVTAWLASTGTDDDIFQLFGLYTDALKGISTDLSADDRTPFEVAGRSGWLQTYAYTNRAGVAMKGALAGVLGDKKDLTYIVVIEARSQDWDRQVDVFNAMLARISIDR